MPEMIRRSAGVFALLLLVAFDNRGAESLGPSSRRTGLSISEIMYHPAPREDGRLLEFIEIHNSQAISEDLSGYRISGDVDYKFPEGTMLAAGRFLVVARLATGIVQCHTIQASRCG